jgi:hypothetical protein
MVTPSMIKAWTDEVIEEVHMCLVSMWRERYAPLWFKYHIYPMIGPQEPSR